MKPQAKHDLTQLQSRRRFLRNLLGASAATGVVGSGFPSTALANILPEKDSKMPLSILVRALRATDKDICIAAAARLESLNAMASSFDLHLRSAGLDAADATSIAAAIRGSTADEQLSLRSFSSSYNPGIGELGAVALINSLPPTLSEIGMVGCSLSDESGGALLDWVQNASSIRMICVEGNAYSPQMRQRISDLRKDRAGLTVIV
ncbi:MAG: twin-arginine translocation signal domain-containing protein [Alphaproteobacteria bacterium]